MSPSAANAPCAYDLERIRRVVRVAEFEHHAEIASTNDRALTRGTEAAAPVPLLVLAERQSAGRGRGANRWWSAAGSITFSLLIEQPAQAAERRPQIALAAGIAVARALDEFAPGEGVMLKWPNDVELRGRKVCGILVEVPPGRPDRAVIGVGLNVNNSFAAAPPELARTGIALCDAIGQELPLTDVLLAILGGLIDELAAFAQEPERLIERWSERCSLTGRCVEVSQCGERFAGLCTGIDEAGALLLHTEAGPQRFIAGTVRRVE